MKKLAMLLFAGMLLVPFTFAAQTDSTTTPTTKKVKKAKKAKAPKAPKTKKPKKTATDVKAAQ